MRVRSVERWMYFYRRFYRLDFLPVTETPVPSTLQMLAALSDRRYSKTSQNVLETVSIEYRHIFTASWFGPSKPLATVKYLNLPKRFGRVFEEFIRAWFRPSSGTSDARLKRVVAALFIDYVLRCSHRYRVYKEAENLESTEKIFTIAIKCKLSFQRHGGCTRASPIHSVIRWYGRMNGNLFIATVISLASHLPLSVIPLVPQLFLSYPGHAL